ncbi:MAG: sialidase family protein [Thermoplasmatota archaeon]
MRAPFAVLLALVAAFAGCIAAPQTTSTPTSPTTPATSSFALGNVVTVDPGTIGVSEPSILVDPTGAIWISGPTGLVTPLVDQNPQPYTHDTSMFKSADGGKTWTNMVQVPGYGRDPCPGGGDSDIAASPDKAVYLVDLWLGNVPIDVTTDGGQTWTFNCYTSAAPGVDRQWVAATNKYVWIAVDQLATGAEIYRADKMGLPTDGLVFGPPQNIDGNGPLVVDQTDGTLYVAASGESILVSSDNGATFTPHQTGLKGHDLSKSFISIALDAKGDVFVAGAGKNGLVVSASADKGKTWTPGVVFAPYGTDASKHAEYAFAWVAAGGDGTMDLAWYGQPPHDGTNTTYYLYAIQKTNFLADPTNASFDFTQVSAAPIATKPLCQGINLAPPTPCDADGTHTRALGDFFESGVDAQGNFVIAFNDANGHTPPYLKFAKQTMGALAPGGAPNFGK